MYSWLLKLDLKNLRWHVESSIYLVLDHFSKHSIFVFIAHTYCFIILQLHHRPSCSLPRLKLDLKNLRNGSYFEVRKDP
jgi:hypothetical protein